MAMTPVITVEHSPATTPAAPGPARRPPGSGGRTGSGSHDGTRRGVRRNVRRHGSPGVGANAAPPGACSDTSPGAARPIRHAAGAEHDDAGVRHRRAAADGLAVDTAGHAAGQLQQLHRPVGGHVEQRVVGLERGVGEGDGDRSRAADDVAAGDERSHRAGRRPAFADHDDDRCVGADGGRSLDAHDAPAAHARTRQRLVAGHGPPVDLDRQPRVEAEGVAEGAERIVRR